MLSYKGGTPNWSVKDSEDYYGHKRWGDGHFSVDTKGFTVNDIIVFTQYVGHILTRLMKKLYTELP